MDLHTSGTCDIPYILLTFPSLFKSYGGGGNVLPLMCVSKTSDLFAISDDPLCCYSFMLLSFLTDYLPFKPTTKNVYCIVVKVKSISVP